MLFDDYAMNDVVLRLFMKTNIQGNGEAHKKKEE